MERVTASRDGVEIAYATVRIGVHGLHRHRAGPREHDLAGVRDPLEVAFGADLEGGHAPPTREWTHAAISRVGPGHQGRGHEERKPKHESKRERGEFQFGCHGSSAKRGSREGESPW